MHNPKYESHGVSLSIKQRKYLIHIMIIAQSVTSKENLWLKLSKLTCFNLSFLVDVYYNVGLSAEHTYFILERQRVNDRDRGREKEKKTKGEKNREKEKNLKSSGL